jgi:protein arginine kinase activator
MINVVCQVCQQRPASVHITEPRDDQSADVVHICHHCLLQHQIDLDQDFAPIRDLLGDSLQDQDTATVTPPVSSGQACPACGMTTEEFNENRHFGCAHDPDHFGEEVIDLLERLHGSSHHVGRTPNRPGTSHTERAIHRRVLYEKQLEQAIAEEDYERAAQLRDRLRELDP